MTLSFAVYSMMILCGLTALGAEEVGRDDLTPSTAVPSVPIFNFNPPGARSLGMGAAFIGIADDATASESNPAGLAQLSTPEFSINFRSTETENPATDPFSGFFDEVSTFESRSTGPSFLSYTRPLPKNKAVLSVYYQQAANLESRESFTLNQFEESLNRFDLLLEHIGLSAATRIGEHVAVGVSIRFTRLDLEITNQFSQFVLDSNAPIFETPNPLLDRFEVFDEYLESNDEEITFNAGILVNPGGKFSVGAVFKQGADFEVEGTRDLLFAFPFLDLEFPFTLTTNGKITVPDAYGLGVAYRPSSAWTLGLDAVRVRYSETSSRFAAGVELSDETEIHLGIEYAFPLGSKQTPFFVRAGFFTNPDHDGTELIDSDQEFITLGAGVFVDNRFQIDGAIAISDDNTETLVSLVWRL